MDDQTSNHFARPDSGLGFESSSPLRAYHHVTRTAVYGFVMALPLLIAYEFFILMANQGEIRISSEIWMKQGLSLLNGVMPLQAVATMHIMAVVVLVIGIAVFIHGRKKKIPLRFRYGVWVVLESMIYAVVLGFVISFMTQKIMENPFMIATAQMSERSIGEQLALSIGAGLYEELFFRVLLLGGLFWVLRIMLPQKKILAYTIAAVVGALLFSAHHYGGTFGDPWEMSSFIFRALFGLALNVVFLVRGFGVAAWTHALYDILVVIYYS